MAAKFHSKSYHYALLLLRTLSFLEVVRIERVVLSYKYLEARRWQLMWTLSPAPTWEKWENRSMEYYCYHYYLVVVVVVVVDDDTYYWVYLSSGHPFRVYYKVRQVLLQSAMVCYYQVRQFYYKVRQNTNPPPPGVKIPRDLYWESKTYKVRRSINDLYGEVRGEREGCIRRRHI